MVGSKVLHYLIHEKFESKALAKAQKRCGKEKGGETDGPRRERINGEIGRERNEIAIARTWGNVKAVG